MATTSITLGRQFALASLWPTAGAMMLVKLAIVSALGEFSKREIELAWSLIPSRKQTRPGE